MDSQAIDKLIKSNYHRIFLSGKVNLGKSDPRGAYHIAPEGSERIGLCGMPLDDQFDCGVMGEEQASLVQTFDTETVRYRRLQSGHPIGDYRFCNVCLIILLNVVYHDTPLKSCPYDYSTLRYWTDETHMLCPTCEKSVEPRLTGEDRA